jgi:hypothetical protein
MGKITSAYVEDARSWGLAPWMAGVLLAAPLVAVAGMTLLLPFRDVFFWLTDEDSVVEWAQFACLLGIVLASGAVTVVAAQRRMTWAALLFGAITLAAVFVTGEEISWGQRVFGWATPEILSEANRQNESNIHNIVPIQRAFGIAELLAGAYGLFVPLVLVAAPQRWRLPQQAYLVAPSLALGSAFAVALVYRFSRLTFLDDAGRAANRYGELAELVLYAAILVHLALSARRLRLPSSRGVSGVAAAAPGPGSPPGG